MASPAPLTSITLGTRRSKLARVQTDMVVAQLAIQHPTLEVKVHAMDPLGDRDKTTALYKFGEKSLWTGELEELLEKGDVGGIVHSLKGKNCSKDRMLRN
jgi:hydroxymethylbilane synthase